MATSSSEPAAAPLGTGNIEMTTQPRPQEPPLVPYQFDYAAHAVKRVEIEDDKKLRLHLQDWEDERKQQLLSIESYRGRCNAAKTELYQLMGFYSVFQGVVFTAVATASKLTCQTSLCPALLSLLTSIATAISVHYKLSYFETQKLKFIRAQDAVTDIIDKIRMLKGAGKAFDFAKAETEDSEKQKLKKQNIEDERKSHGGFYGAVMLFLAVFSLIILACCVIVLCWDQDKNTLKPCASTLCWWEVMSQTQAVGNRTGCSACCSAC